jgi:crotonobetainyl-CoA:carnitine CoA-transferase CaiB-like acyl-CoA transferase
MLTDFTILDLSEGAAGPFCTKLFADYGARVIKVERPSRGDPARRVGPFPEGPSAGSGRSPNPDPSAGSGRSAGALFLFLNTGKESITLDLATATGRRLLLELAEHADALIEGFPSGHLDALGLGIEALHQRNPRLIITSVTAFGQRGPYASHRWSELTAFAAGGQMSLCGNPDREPLMPAGHQGSYQAGIHAFGATLAGLLSVGVIEIGQHIDIAEMEALASTLELYLPDYTYVGREVLTRRRGNILSPTLGIFPCADGFVGIHVMSRNFPSFARVMGEEWMIADERFQSERGRLINNDEIMARIYAWAADRTRDEIYQRAGEERSTIAPVLTIPEVPEQPQMRAREAFRTIDDPRAGPLTYTGPPFRPGEGEWELRPAPRLGEHNAAVYEELLGLSAQDIVALRQAGVI